MNIFKFSKKPFSANLSYKVLNLIKHPESLLQLNKQLNDSLISNLKSNFLSKSKIQINIFNPFAMNFLNSLTQQQSKITSIDNNFISSLLYFYLTKQSAVNDLISLEERRNFYEKFLGKEEQEQAGINKYFNSTPIIHFSLDAGSYFHNTNKENKPKSNQKQQKEASGENTPNESKENKQEDESVSMDYECKNHHKHSDNGLTNSKLAQILYSKLKKSINNLVWSEFSEGKLSDIDNYQIKEFFQIGNSINNFEYDDNTLQEAVLYYFKYILQFLSKKHTQQPKLIISNYDKYFYSNVFLDSINSEISFFNKFINEVVLSNVYCDQAFLMGNYLLKDNLIISKNNLEYLPNEEVKSNFINIDFENIQSNTNNNTTTNNNNINLTQIATKLDSINTTTKSSANSDFIVNEIQRLENSLNNLLFSKEKYYIDSMKLLVELKNALNSNNINNINLINNPYNTDGKTLNTPYIPANNAASTNTSNLATLNINSLLQEGLTTEKYSFNNFLLERIYENYITINKENQISLAHPLFSNALNRVIFPNQSAINSLSYKHQLAYYYYNYLERNQVNEFFKYLKHLFSLIAENAKTSKNFDKFPNFSFRTEKELDDYLIDILTLDLNSVKTSLENNNERINIYDVDDDSIPLSEHIKKFTLIVYEDKQFAVYVKGNKLKKAESTNVNEIDEFNIGEILSQSQSNKKQVKPISSTASSTTKSLLKINETRLNSVGKSEAINFALKANKNIQTIYIICVSNYLKQIEYLINKIDLTQAAQGN